MKADRRLAEIRRRCEWRMSIAHRPYMISVESEDVRFLFDRIERLERLVPDADLLDQILDIAEDDDSRSDDGEIISAITDISAAIRKYREER